MNTQRAAIVFGVLWLAACGGGGSSSGGNLPGPVPSPSSSPIPFLPLKSGEVWTYGCVLGTPAPSASIFPKVNQILGMTTVNGTLTYEYELQIPTSPTQSTTQIQLLANDTHGDTVLYGYMSSPSSSPAPIASPTVVVAERPGADLTTYDYEAENGATVLRIFCCTGQTHRTVFGVFNVDEYFEGSHVVSESTDGYGYAAGLGSVEEDHNFNDPDPAKRVDCLITATPSP
jgi:hypothetical protein